MGTQSSQLFQYPPQQHCDKDDIRKYPQTLDEKLVYLRRYLDLV